MTGSDPSSCHPTHVVSDFCRAAVLEWVSAFPFRSADHSMSGGSWVSDVMRGHASYCG